jgi:hypothetical protein
MFPTQNFIFLTMEGLATGHSKCFCLEVIDLRSLNAGIFFFLKKTCKFNLYSFLSTKCKIKKMVPAGNVQPHSSLYGPRY